MANKSSLNTVLISNKVGDKAALLQKKTIQARRQEIVETSEKRQAFINQYFSKLDKKAQEGLSILLDIVFPLY